MASCLLNIATTARRYNSYSGAAIGGTLLMLIPVAYYDGLLFEFAKSFAISALLGGGLGAYLSLRKDGVGEKAGEFGSAVVNKVGRPEVYILPRGTRRSFRSRRRRTPGRSRTRPRP